jgi:hypothetical protein
VHVQEPVMSAGLEISLRIGQHVRHRDFNGKRVTGVVRGLSIDSEDVLCAEIALDDAIVITPINSDDHELRIYRQYVPAHELAPFDERDELIAGLLQALRDTEQALSVLEARNDTPPHITPVLRRQFETLREAIAKAEGAS